MDAEESKLADLYDLDKEQIAWRRAKISQLGSAEYIAQEYPLTPSDAFISSNFNSFIPADLVVKARREKAEAYEPLIARRPIYRILRTVVCKGRRPIGSTAPGVTLTGRGARRRPRQNCAHRSTRFSIQRWIATPDITAIRMYSAIITAT